HATTERAAVESFVGADFGDDDPLTDSARCLLDLTQLVRGQRKARVEQNPAEGPGISRFVVEQVASDDSARAGEPRALHDIQPDAAAPDHQDALARGHPRVTNHGADASGDAARSPSLPIELTSPLGDGWARYR